MEKASEVEIKLMNKMLLGKVKIELLRKIKKYFVVIIIGIIILSLLCKGNIYDIIIYFSNNYSIGITNEAMDDTFALILFILGIYIITSKSDYDRYYKDLLHRNIHRRYGYMYIRTSTIVLITDAPEENTNIQYRRLVLECPNKDMLMDLKHGEYVLVRYLESNMLPLEIKQINKPKKGEEAYIEDLSTKNRGSYVTIMFRTLIMIASLISVFIALILCMLINLPIYILL